MKGNSTGKQQSADTFYFRIIVQLLCGFCNYGNICCNVNINYAFFFCFSLCHSCHSFETDKFMVLP